MMMSFNDQLDADVIFFIIFLAINTGLLILFVKKACVHTKSIITNETLNERKMGFRFHYKLK